MMSDMIGSGLAVALLMAGTAAQAADPNRIGPVTFRCDDGSAIEATFDNALDPATVLLVRNGQQFTLPQAMSASGARYLGNGIKFWNKGDDAMVEWQGTKLECRTAE
jgi:membrane-bound inhibitor of C-type lysozyme